MRQLQLCLPGCACPSCLHRALELGIGRGQVAGTDCHGVDHDAIDEAEAECAYAEWDEG